MPSGLRWNAAWVRWEAGRVQTEIVASDQRRMREATLATGSLSPRDALPVRVRVFQERTHVCTDWIVGIGSCVSHWEQNCMALTI